MFLVGLLSWWYGRGWQQRVDLVWEGLKRTGAAFSVGQLLQTLFAPFRQISAGTPGGSFAQQMRALFDQTISRFVGFMVRTITIVAGSITLLLRTVIGGITIIGWPLVPLLPFVGLVLFVIGWVPQWM